MLVKAGLSPQPVVTVLNLSLNLLYKVNITIDIHVPEKQYCLFRSKC